MLSSSLRALVACVFLVSPLAAAAQDLLEPPPGMVLPGAPDPAADPTQEGDVVVARIGATEILLTQVISDMYSLPDEERQRQPFDELYEQLLQYRIDRALVVQAADATGLRRRPDFMERMARIEEQVLTETFMDNIVRSKVTPNVVRERYDAYVADDAGRTEYRARYILAQDEADATALKARLDGGEDFETLARGLDYPGADKGGDLGFFTADTMVPELVETVRTLSVGEISEPFQSQFGWHLIKLEETRVAEPKSLDEMREILFNQMGQEVVEDVLAELYVKFPVERFNRDGTPVDDTPAEDAAPAE